jgi:hypothetical protein
VILGCLTLSSAAWAGGFEVGGRVGYGIPMGDAGKDSKLSDGISGSVPLTLDVGYRVIDPLFVGAYLGYGFGFLASKLQDSCDAASADCSVSTFDIGAQAQYHLAPGSGTDFWFGGGLGYESLSTSESGGGLTIDSSTSALPQIMLQLGLDFGDAAMAYGPFLRFTHATYSSSSFDCSGANCGFLTGLDGDIPSDQQSSHQWLTIGVRGTFVL